MAKGGGNSYTPPVVDQRRKIGNFKRKLDKKEFIAGYRVVFPCLGLTVPQLDALFERFDTDGNGRIRFHDFCVDMAKLQRIQRKEQGRGGGERPAF